jgi:hypothetical protein
MEAPIDEPTISSVARLVPYSLRIIHAGSLVKSERLGASAVSVHKFRANQPQGASPGSCEYCSMTRG